MTDPTPDSGDLPDGHTPDVLGGEEGAPAPGSPTRTISRRTAIGLLAGAGAAAALGLAYVAKEKLGDDPAPPPPPAAANTSSTGGIVAIGEAYLAVTPDEQTEEALQAVLDSSTPVDEQVAADFTEGRTVQLDGWVFAVTEARVAALAALQARTPATS